MRVAVILGTRPEIIKMAPVVRELQRTGTPFLILHTGQHYSYEMDKVFFEQLALPGVDYNLNVGSGSHGAQTGAMLAGIEGVLQRDRPSTILVQGDTNTVAAGALAASKLGIRAGHVEAGLRSGDRRMPEEINRIVADHVCDDLFPPTEASARNLRGEGLPESRILVTGNTIVDAVQQNLGLARGKGSIVENLDLTPKEFVLITAHRQENVDDPCRFQSILDGAAAVGRDLAMPVVYPIHPRARKMLAQHRLRHEGITLTEPTDFLGFLQLENQARIVLTDSGGVQEETCILGVPCVTLRDSTERPETIEVGANTLAGVDPAAIRSAAAAAITRKGAWRNPFGDGKAAQRIVARCREVTA